MLTGGYIPSVTQIKNEPENVIGNSRASSGMTSLESGCIQFHSTNTATMAAVSAATIAATDISSTTVTTKSTTGTTTTAKVSPSPQPLAPPQQLPPQMPMRQAINRQDRIDTLPISL